MTTKSNNKQKMKPMVAEANVLLAIGDWGPMIVEMLKRDVEITGARVTGEKDLIVSYLEKVGGGKHEKK